MTTEIEPGDRCTVIAGNCPHSNADIGVIVTVMQVGLGCAFCFLCGEASHVHKKPLADVRKDGNGFGAVKPLTWLAKLPPESEVKKFDLSEPVKVPERIDA